MIPVDFFQDLPTDISFYASQIIFNYLYDIKQSYFQKNAPENVFDLKSNQERYESMKCRFLKSKKELLNQLEKIEEEILEIDQKIKNFENEVLKCDLISNILSSIEEKENENEKVIQEMNQKMENWKIENGDRKLVDLKSPQDISCLLSLLNIEYDTKEKSSLTNIDPISINLQSYGDKKRLMDLTLNQPNRLVSSISITNLFIKPMDKLDEEKVNEWKYKDVLKWISLSFPKDINEEIEAALKKNKIDGKQFLLLKDEEIKEEIGITSEYNQKKVKEWIDILKRKSHVNLIELTNVPDELKCPLTNKVMEDPVVASDGQTYERKAIEDFFKTSIVSPVIHKEFKDFTLVSNKGVKRKYEDFIKENN